MMRAQSRLAGKRSILVCLVLAVACGDSEGGSEGGGGSGAAMMLPDGQCREQSDCAAGDECKRPGVVEICGGAGCPPDECNADFDCTNQGLGDICVTTQGVSLCQPACTQTGCLPQEQCAADGRCEPQACASKAECPDNFDCLQNVCFRVICEDDGTCDDGFCVRKECYPEAGRCEPPPA